LASAAAAIRLISPPTAFSVSDSVKYGVMRPGAIHIIEAAVGFRQAGMHEYRPVFLDDDVAIAQPAPVQPPRRERIDVLDEAERVLAIPVVLVQVRRTVPRHDAGVIAIRASAPFVRSVVGERRIRLRGHVAEIEQQVHDLVIAQQDVDLAACRGRFVFEPHQQIQNLAHLLSAIRVITRLHEVRRSARPSAAGINQMRGLEDGGERVQRPVNVPDRDDAWGCRLRPARGGCRHRERGGENQRQQK
jgi:hypothetical protein